VHALWENFRDFIAAVAGSCESCGLWLWVVVHCGKFSAISLQRLPICVAIVGFCVFIAGFCGLAVWLYNMGLNTKKGDDNMGQWVIGYGPRVHGPFCYQHCLTDLILHGVKVGDLKVRLAQVVFGGKYFVYKGRLP
jgi:hypothetical protein